MKRSFYLFNPGLMERKDNTLKFTPISIDEQGNETLFEILLTIDGKEEFGKNYVLLVPVNAEEDENGEVEIQAYSFIENEDGTEGELQPIPEDSEDEWNMIEEVFNSFMEE